MSTSIPTTQVRAAEKTLCQCGHQTKDHLRNRRTHVSGACAKCLCPKMIEGEFKPFPRPHDHERQSFFERKPFIPVVPGEKRWCPICKHFARSEDGRSCDWCLTEGKRDHRILA